ncbi:MAG: MFS transporter [Bacteroidota bacterium]|nr:MFS transporter [Odoribacter sp.]MDP3645311.1 MFS transporter [Bacteroidota bacterium]
MTNPPSSGIEKNMIIIFGVTLIAVMGIASITPAFPGIIRYFGISTQQVGWLIAAFTLPGIFLTPLTGILADRLGRKLVLVPSLFIFGIAGFLCSFMRDFHSLLLFLFIEGIGAAGLSSINITLIGDLYSGEKRTALMGYNASILSIGTAAYPALGGLIATFGWQYIFYLPLLAIPLGVFVIFGLNNPEPKDHQGIGEYFRRIWKSINQRSVWGLFLVNMLVFILLYGAYLTYFPILLSERLHASSVQIGMMMSVMSLVTAATSSQLGRINKRFRSKTILLTGVVFYFLSMVSLLISQSWVQVIGSVTIFGLGHGLLIPSIQNLLVGFASIKERAAFMSVNSMVLRIGQTIGPLLIGVFYVLASIQGSLLAGAVVALIMFGAVAGMVKGVGQKSERP